MSLVFCFLGWHTRVYHRGLMECDRCGALL